MKRAGPARAVPAGGPLARRSAVREYHDSCILSPRVVNRVAVFVLLLGTSLAAQIAGRSPPVLVQRVLDGETIRVASIGRVRLIGVVVPKTTGRPGDATPAQEAERRLAGLLANRWVRLEYDSALKAKTHSAYVFLEDGRFVNEWLVREGLARVSNVSARLRRLETLKQAQREAQQAHRGIWRTRGY